MTVNWPRARVEASCGILSLVTIALWSEFMSTWFPASVSIECWKRKWLTKMSSSCLSCFGDEHVIFCVIAFEGRAVTIYCWAAFGPRCSGSHIFRGDVKVEGASVATRMCACSSARLPDAAEFVAHVLYMYVSMSCMSEVGGDKVQFEFTSFDPALTRIGSLC